MGSRGSMFGFVGPNGAGKTTTLSMVTGLLRPDTGRVEVLGHDVWADPAAAKAQMGVLPDDEDLRPSLWPRATPLLRDATPT
ncbi:ABC transporter ATP-binding protein [Cutibacterium acnes JCM 18909]|nr:ABC transporter ATP-binding protein [Cutibacterium acnes JCM 18909]